MADTEIDVPADSTAIDLYRNFDVAIKKQTTSSEMSMDEFAGWMTQHLGGSIDQALQQAAFMLCCDVIAQDIGKSTLRLRERTGPKTSRIVGPKEHSIARMLALEPNRRHTWPEFVEMEVYWACFTSNSYSVVLRDRMNNPLELIPLQTGRVFELVAGRDVFYDVTAGTEQERALLGQPFMRVPERDMIHVRNRMIDGMDGLSTLAVGRTTLDSGKSISEYRRHLFDEDGATRGVFIRKFAGDAPLPQEAFDRLRSQFKLLMNNFRRLSEPIVLEGDFDFKPISAKPNDLEFAKQFADQINATCRLLRVPPHKVFQMDGVKYENLETSEKMYVGDTLVPVCEKRENRYAKILLTEDERLDLFFEHDREEMTLRDPQREAERTVKLTERGILLIDEARAAMGYNELPNGQGQVRLVPTNMSLIDVDGNIVLGGASTSAPDGASTDTPGADTAPTKTGADLIRLVTSK